MLVSLQQIHDIDQAFSIGRRFMLIDCILDKADRHHRDPPAATPAKAWPNASSTAFGSAKNAPLCQDRRF